MKPPKKSPDLRSLKTLKDLKISLTRSQLWHSEKRDLTPHNAAYKGVLSKEWYQDQVNTVNEKLREVDGELGRRAGAGK